MAENILIADDNELPPPANNKIVIADDDDLPPALNEKKKPSPNGGTPLQPGTKATSLSKSTSQSVSVNPKNNPIPLTKSGSISGVPDFSGIVKDAVTPKVNPSNKVLPGIGKSLISETPDLSAPKIQSDNLNPQPSDLAQAQISGLKSREELDADKNSLQLADYLEKSGKSLKDFDPVDFKKHINTINGETEETPFIGKAMAAYKSDLDAYGKAGAIINRNIDVAKADIDSKLGPGTFGKYQKLMQDYQSQFKFKEPLIKKIDGDISTITQQLTDLQQKAKSAKNPVEYGQIKKQYGALYSQAEQLQKQRDEAAGPLAQMEQELKQFSSTPEFQKLNDLYSAQQTLSEKQESLLDKHPDAKQTLQRWEDVQKFTDGVIRQQKLVNPAGAMALTLGGDVLKTITKTAKNLSAIPSIVEKATGTEGLVKHSPLVIFDAVTDAIHDVSAAADNEVNNLTPSNMDLPVSQHYKIVDGNKIFVDKNDNALFARDIDGYKLGDSAEKKAIEKYNANPEAKNIKTQDKKDWGVMLNEAVKFGLDIVGPLKGIGTGLTELGLAGSAAKGYANGTLTLMGYGLNDAYESAKQSAPNLTDQQASQYALGSQAAIGLMFSMLGGAKMKYITGDGENIFAKIRSAISKEKGLKLDANDIKAIDGGLSPYQVGQRKVLGLMKESLLQGGEMGVIMPTANALMNGVTNKLVGYKALGTDIDLKESFVNGGAPAMLVGAVTGFSGVNRSSIKNEAWSKITKDDATAKATLNFINQSTEDGLYTQEQADRLKQRISYTVKNLEPFAGTLDESSKKILANLYDHKFQLTEKAMSLTDDAAKKVMESQIKDIDNDIAETIKGNQDNFKSQIAVGIRDGLSSMAETENRGKEIPNENSLTKDAEQIKNETGSNATEGQELNNSSGVSESNGNSGEVQQGIGETTMSDKTETPKEESNTVEWSGDEVKMNTQSGIESTDNTNVIPEQVSPISKMETTENPALKDVESTAKALSELPKETLRDYQYGVDMENFRESLSESDKKDWDELMSLEFDKNANKKRVTELRDKFKPLEQEWFSENDSNPQRIAEQYHENKINGTNPDYVKAVEEALSNKQITNEEQSTNADITGKTTDAEPVITTDETSQKSEETKSTEESGEGQREKGEDVGSTGEEKGDGLGISKQRIFDKFGKKFEKTKIGWTEIAKRTLDTLSEIAHGKGTTTEKEAEHQVNQMHDDIVSGKPIEVSDHKIVTTAAHIMDIEQRMDDLAGEKGGNITDNGILAEELLKQRDKALFVLDKLGSQSGRNLGIFSGVFSKLDDGGIAINKVKIEGKLGYKLPATKEELKDSDLTETQKAEALKYMNELADVKKKYEEAKKRYEETEKRLTEEQVAAKIKEAFEKGKKAGTVKKVTLSKEKIEKTKAELGQAVQDFMQAFGGISMAEGNVMPSVTKSLKKIGVKLMELGYATAENVFDKVVEYITQQTGKKPDIEHYRPEFEKKAKLKIPNNLIKEAVENGATTIDKVVNEIQKQFPGELPRTIRDAISGYGETTKPSDDPVDTQVRKIKRMGRYMSALEDIENGIRPLKTGPQRDKLEADELAELAKIRVGLSKMPIDAAEAENQLKTAQEALEKRLENSIAELNRQIETGERPEKAKPTETTPYIEELKQEKERLLKIRDSIDNPPKSDLEKLIDKAIDVTNNINKAKKEGNKKDEKLLRIEKEATDGAITNLIDKVIELNTDKSQVELARKIKAKQNDIDKLKTKLENNDLSTDKKGGVTSPELKELEEERRKLLDELSNRRIAQNRATALDKIKGLSENENATTITKSMVDNGHISDIMDDIIQKGAAEEEVADKMFDALKSVLPDVTRQQMNDAITGNGEFKKESKQAVKTEIQTKTQRVKQIANLETKLEALKAANDYHAESDKNNKKQIKSDYEKNLQQQIADLRKQRSTAAKVDEINAEIKRLQDGGEIFRKAIGNKTQASEELVNARKKLKDLYNEKGLKRETGSKDTVAAKSLVLDNLSDNLKSHQDALTDRANEATNNGDTDTAAKINDVKKQISDIQNLLDKNPGADLKEKIDKAYHALDDLKVKDKDLKKEIDDIKDNFQKDWQKSADELSKQRITKQYQTEINTAKRKMAANHVSEIPTTKLDVSKDSNLTDFQRENKRIKSQLNQMVQRAAEKNKTFGDKVLDWRRSLMTGTIHTLERVAISGVSKIIFDPLVNQTAGRLTAMMPGMKDTSIPLKATSEGYKSWFKFRNQAAAEAHISKSEKAYNDAIDNFEKAKGTPQEKNALKKLHEAEYNHAQAQLYKFIYTNLLFDTKDIMLHDATPFDEYAGKGLRQNFSDLHGKDEKLLYIINSLNRMHLVVKNPSARRSFVESYTANLMKMQSENVPLDANARMRAMDMAMLQYEQGKYSNETWFTKTLSKVRNINAPMRYFIKYAIPVARVSTNILKYGVDMTPIGISEASVRYFKGAADGMKLNAEEGKEFNTAMEMFRQGVNRIPKEDKEYIARVMSRGLFGAGLMLAALSMYKNGNLKYGGEFDEKRRKPRKGTDGDLEHGQWEINGHKIGKFGSGVLNHLPEFIAVAMAVNTADVYTEEKGDDKDTYDALTETLRSDINEIYERLPIPNKVLDNIFTLPPIPIVTDIDKWTDVDEDGEPIARKAKTAWEKSEMNIGLRKNVPEKKR